jgi:DNA-binding CsgD family transcriptional regulator
MAIEPPAGSSVRLTPAERRVLERVLVGETNKEIALRLSCSPRTVEFHLAHIFRKTGTETRTRLIATFARAAAVIPGDHPSRLPTAADATSSNVFILPRKEPG